MLEECRKLLNRGAIGDALVRIAEEAKALGIEKVPYRAKRILYDYNMLLNDFETGIGNKARQGMLAKIIDNAYSLIDLANSNQDKDKPKPAVYSTTYLFNDEERFNAIENIFPSKKEDRMMIRRFILNEHETLYMRGLVISALTLNLLKYFENDKFESLYTYTLEDQPLEIRQRAWVAIVLVTMAHDDRISSQPRLVEQMKFICEEGMSDENRNILLVIQFALYKCIQARKTQSVIINDIAPKIEEGIKELKKDGNNDDDMAPRWEEYMKKSGLSDKIQDFLDMQREGVDIMYESFKHLCQAQFFSHKSNWFIPFDIEHPEVINFIKGNKIRRNYFNIIDKARNMCSTDKYCNLSMLSIFPDSQLKQIETQINGGSDTLDNIEGASPEDVVISYMHDLYRYYTLFNKEGYNPFDQILYFGKYNNLKNVVESSQSKHLIADFLLKNEEWAEASYVFDDIAKTDESEDVLQNLAYAIYKANNSYSKSINVLTRCNYLYPNNKWTMKYYAEALSSVGEFEAEEIVLRNCIDLFPDEVNFITMLGRNLTNQKRYQEALEQLFRADLMKENSYRTMSCLAEAAFHLGKLDIAIKYIAKTISSKKAKDHDWINGGHIALLSGDTPLALVYYHKADREIIKKHIEDGNDKKVLIELGVPQDVVTMTFEVLNRENSGK